MNPKRQQTGHPHRTLRWIALLLAFCPALGTAQDELPSRRDAARELFGHLDGSDPKALVAREVFERVLAAADVRSRSLPRLVLVERGLPQALALPGGAVVLNRAMLELLLHDVETNPDLAAARTAYIVGHELAHIAFDTGHRAYYDAVAHNSRQTARVLEKSESNTARAVEERVVEYYGMHYALKAGFRLHLLLMEPVNLWRRLEAIQREHGFALGYHPNERERYELLHTQLQGIVDAYPLFHWGTRLLQLGWFDDSIRLLDRYREHYAGSELLTNLGIAHYQKAAAILAGCSGHGAVQYYLPLRIRPQTIDGRTIRRGPASCRDQPDFTEQSRIARDYLTAAAQMQPRSAEARVNLASVLLLMGYSSQALGPAAEAVDLDGGSGAEIVFALAEAGFDRENDRGNGRGARSALEKIAASADPLRALAFFNLARLSETAGEAKRARTAWREFLDVEPAGPWADLARIQLGESVAGGSEDARCSAPEHPTGAASDAQLRLGPPPGGPDPGLERKSLIGGNRPARIWSSPPRQALEIDGEIMLVEQPLETDAQRQLEECERAHAVFLDGGRLDVYDGFAVEQRGQGAATLLRFVQPPSSAPIPLEPHRATGEPRGAQR